MVALLALCACTEHQGNPTLDLRAVQNTGDATSGSVCDRNTDSLRVGGKTADVCAVDGTAVFSLGPLLATIHYDSARKGTNPEGEVEFLVDVAKKDAPTLDSVARANRGKTIAVLLHGQVVCSAEFDGPLDGHLQIVPPAASAAEVAKELHAR